MTSIVALLIVAVFSTSFAQNSDVDLKQVKCLVCRTIVDEYLHEVKKIDPSRNIEIGQYNLDDVGNAKRKKVPLSKSEIHLSNMLDTICKKMDNYARAKYKSNGKLTLVNLVSEGGNGMNPILSEVDFVQDGDLNKSLEYFCTDIVNEYEDAFIDIASKNIPNARNKICNEEAEYCSSYGNDQDDNEDIDDIDSSEENDYDKTEL